MNDSVTQWLTIGKKRIAHHVNPYRWRLKGWWRDCQVIPKHVRWEMGEKRRASYWEQLGYSSRWLFILGCNNSGTTLLQRFLGGHPEIAELSRFEGKHITFQLPRPHWLGVRRMWSERLDAFRWTEEANPIDVAHLMFDWLGAQSWDPHKLILEKSPEHTLAARWFQKICPNSYFIGLVRNGYAVAEGIHRRTQRPMEACARHWNTVNRIMIDDSAHLKHFLLVSYEDLAINSEPTLHKLAEFLNISYRPFEPLIAKKWAIHNSGGAPAGLQDFNRSSFKHLSAHDIEVIRKNAYEMLDHLGYLDSPLRYLQSA